MSPEHDPSRHSSGPLFGTGIIIALLLVGAFYYLSSEINRRNTTMPLPIIPSGDTTISPPAPAK